MSKILLVAWREFKSTAMTKGFIIGALIVPLLLVALIPVVVLLIMQGDAPEIKGSVAVVDRSGQVYPELSRLLSPEEIAGRRAAQQERVKELLGETTKELPGGEDGETLEQVDQQLEMGMKMAESHFPTIDLTVERLPADTDVEAEKEPLREGSPKNGGRLALIVVDEFAVEPDPETGEYKGFELFHRPKMDERLIDDELRYSARTAIRETRIRAAGLTPERVEALTSVSSDTKEVTAEGERASMAELGQMLPFAFMLLLIISTMVGGQYLLTTTIEEKSSRVIELLLSAVSPMQLMTGKILGQMLVGLALLAVYSGLGIAGLVSFALADLVDPMAIVYMFIYFFLAYFMMASLLAAIGSAVNELREAQSLQTPVMLIMMLPYFLWMPIMRDPDSTFSVILSMIPPIAPFTMMLRVTSPAADVPFWQIALSIGICLVACYVFAWIAAKIFRVGLLMYGKPPNFTTLVRWVRMA